MPPSPASKVVVIGLDCAEPTLVFDSLADRLPNLSRLRAEGAWGTLRSCDPPITVPAWMSMMSSKDPGTLGYYGFRNRADRSYEKMTTATSLAVREPLLWDHLGRAGKRVILLGVPQTYPPRPVNGVMVTDFLTPSIESNYTFPPELKQEIAGLADVHPYEFDVSDFRTPDKGKIRDSLIRMTDKRFALAEHLIQTRPWDFFMMVEMGTDRVHHAFWQYMDHGHHRYEPGNPFESVIPDYYVHVDQKIGHLLDLLPADTTVLVVSDHGAQCMDGGIAINEWLIREGYLVLQEPVNGPSRLEGLKVDWPKTTAWGAGGYYGRLFLNVQGREPHGLIPADQYEATRDKLVAELEALGGPNGEPIGTRVLKPENLYRQVRGIAPPDLFVYFGDLRWRSVGTIGGPDGIHTFENDTGPDDANHAPEGLIIARGPGIEPRGPISGMQLMDVTPTVLRLFGLDVPADMQGKVLAPIFRIVTDMIDEPLASRPSTTIAPWLSVRKTARAVEFYKAAFGAIEVYRIEGPDDDVVSRLSIQDAEFWLGGESPAHGNFSPESLGGGSVRIILTVPDPDAVFAQAIAAGATEIYPMSEGHGWRIGRVVDPFGHHWEIGRPLAGG